MRVLRSGWYVQGIEHDAFERELADFTGVAGAVGVASGTDALRIALGVLGAGHGTVVATAPNAGGYTSVAAAMLGCEGVVVDVDPSDGTISVESLDRSAPEDIDILVVTHLYGNVADMEGIRSWCDARGIRIVEDCAQAFGGRLAGSSVGSMGDVGAFSFYPTKNLGAAGDAGAIISNDLELLPPARSLRNYGWGARYEIVMPEGCNSRLDEVQAAILRVGLPLVEGLNARRRSIVGQYRDALHGSPALRMITRNDDGCVAHLAVVCAESPTVRASLEAILTRSGINFDVHYPIPDHEQLGLGGIRPVGDLPGATSLRGCTLTIPAFPAMSAGEVSRVAEALAAAVGAAH